MPSYRFEQIERLGLLAAAALDVLDEEFTEGQLDDDSNPPRTDLYNLANAAVEYVEERAGGDKPIMGINRERDLDNSLNELIKYGGGDGSHVDRLFAKLTKDSG